MTKAQLKRRLVGAVVLVSLAVIFIPMMLDNRGTEMGVGAAIPTRDTGPFDDELAMQRPEAIDRTAAPVAAEPGPATAATQDQPASPSFDPNAQPAPAAGTPAQTTVATPRAWVVQVGSFGQADNAEAVAGKLRAAGFDTVIEKAQVDGGQVYRVQVGPTATEANAEQLRQRISDKLKLDGAVRQHPMG